MQHAFAFSCPVMSDARLLGARRHSKSGQRHRRPEREHPKRPVDGFLTGSGRGRTSLLSESLAERKRANAPMHPQDNKANTALLPRPNSSIMALASAVSAIPVAGLASPAPKQHCALSVMASPPQELRAPPMPPPPKRRIALSSSMPVSCLVMPASPIAPPARGYRRAEKQLLPAKPVPSIPQLQIRPVVRTASRIPRETLREISLHLLGQRGVVAALSLCELASAACVCSRFFLPLCSVSSSTQHLLRTAGMKIRPSCLGMFRFSTTAPDCLLG